MIQKISDHQKNWWENKGFRYIKVNSNCGHVCVRVCFAYLFYI